MGDSLEKYNDIITAVQYGHIYAIVITYDIPIVIRRYMVKLAIVNDRLDIVNYLLDNMEFTQREMSGFLSSGIRWSSLSIIESLVMHGCNITDVAVMYYSIKNNRSPDFIKSLLDMNADITNQSHSRAPVVAMCENPDITPDLILYLLNAKASLEIFTGEDYHDDSNKHYNICDIAFQNCSITFIKTLLNSEYDIYHGADSLLELCLKKLMEIEDDEYKGEDWIEVYFAANEDNLINMFDILIETRTNDVCVYRSIRYILAILIEWKTNEIICTNATRGPIPQDSISDDTNSVIYLEFINQQDKFYRALIYDIDMMHHKIKWRQSNTYESIVETILQRLLDCDIDINSVDHQLWYGGTLQIEIPCRLQTIKSMTHMLTYISKLLDTLPDISPGKRIRTIT